MLNSEYEKRFIKARREFIARDFSFLNDMQQKAVLTTEGPLLLLAGAGSGKTTVLINRVANILKYGRASDSQEIPDGVTEADVEFLESYLSAPDPDYKPALESIAALEPAEPWRVMAITFTNKAANELKERLETMLGPESRDIWALTFHSACVRILRRDGGKIGFSPSFTIYDTADSLSLMKRIMKDLGISEKVYQPRYILSAISRAKDELQGADEYAEAADRSFDPRVKIISEAYSEYSKRLREANALDFDDIIYYTVRLLNCNEDVRSYYQRRFKYILVDEYQDTNNLQYMLVSALAGGYENLCVVGDDDQSIYKFRGATIKNILDFENQYKGARTIRLEQNYRSTNHILGGANDVIQNNVGRKGKELWTKNGDGDKILLHKSESEADEAQFIAEQIMSGIASGENFRDYAVLYRVNSLSGGIEFALKRNGIPYKIYGGTGFFERAEVKDMLAYLCVIANPGDDLRLTRIINTPARGIGAATVDKIRELSQAENTSMFEIMENAEKYKSLARSLPRLKIFSNMIDSLRQSSESLSLDLLYDELLEASGYIRALESSGDPQDDTRRENVLELKSSIVNYMQSTGEPTLSGFLSEISLYTDLDNMVDSENFVTLMTVHSAKGLEFPNVFIVGFEDGIFPSIRSIGEAEEMEEERRLCYVAITRAKRRLTFTCADRRMLYGKTSANPVSRFCEEISSQHIEKPEEPVRRAAAFSFGGYGDLTSDYGEYARYNRPKSTYYSDPAVPPAPPRRRTVSPPKPAAAPVPLPEIKEGDRINHTAFGPGTVLSVKPAGNDALIKVQFDSSGTKQLMLKTASKYISSL